MRTLSAALMALMMLLAACGDSDGGSAASSASWCEFANQIDDGNPLDSVEGEPTPEAMAAAFDEFKSVLADARSAAPSEIRDDVKIVEEAFVAFADMFAEADYNFFAIDETDERIALFDSAEVEAAGDRVTEYNEAECGISSDDTDDDLEGTEE